MEIFVVAGMVASESGVRASGGISICRINAVRAAEKSGNGWESNPPGPALVCPTSVLKTEHHTSDEPSPPFIIYVGGVLSK